MPVFYQQTINEQTKLAIWKIEEDEAFFLKHVPLQRSITHPHKRLQHLAGRYLLGYLFPGFPIDLIEIADTKKPFLRDEAFHFSISHCGDFAAAIVSTTERVGVDIEIVTPKILRVAHKFLHDAEQQHFEKYFAEAGDKRARIPGLTILWCAKEAMFKWWGWGGVDFSEMLRLSGAIVEEEGVLEGTFISRHNETALPVFYKKFVDITLAWTLTKT